MELPDTLHYTEEHAWVRPTSTGVWVVGITDHAQEQLGDIEYVDLPVPGARFVPGAVLAEIESQKSLGEVYAPFDCIVIGVNESLRADPSLVNQDPYGAGWIAELQPTLEPDISQLLDAAGYRAGLPG